MRRKSNQVQNLRLPENTSMTRYRNAVYIADSNTNSCMIIYKAPMVSNIIDADP